MKRYTMLSVLWLFACGAGPNPADDDNSTLKSPLEAEQDDTSDPTELASADDGTEEDAPAEGDVWKDPSDCDEPPTPGSIPGTPSGGGVVIGGGGQAWTGPAAGAVVWCHTDVPIGCPAIEPAPNGGRLVMVQGSSETAVIGGSAGGEPSASANTEAGASSADEDFVGSGSAGEGFGVSGEIDGGAIIFVDAMPAGPGAPASAPLPVVIGGSLPPLPGTCVAVSFGAAGGGSVSVSIDEGASVPAQQPPGPGAPNAGSSAPSGSASGTGAVPAPPVAVPSAPGTAMPALPGVPALPPPGICLGVSFPAPPGIPGGPSTGAPPVPGGHTEPDPSSPHAGCVSVAFAESTDPNAREPLPALPVMCAAPGSPPTPGTPPIAPIAETEPARADEVR